MRLTSAISVLLLTCVSASSAPQVARPTTPFTFNQLTSNNGFAVDVDPKSLTALRTSDGVIAGGIFQIRANTPTPTAMGAGAWTFVNALVADCSGSSVLLLSSRVFGQQGNQLFTITTPVMFDRDESATAPAAVAHSYLCAKGRVEPTPIGKGNALPASYTSFWAKSGS